MSSSVEEDQKNKAERQAAGEFVRGVSAYRTSIEGADVEAGRYHLYIGYNCPWCHRVALARSVLGLEEVISMDVLLPTRTEEGHPQGEGRWQFAPEGITGRNGALVKFPECTLDTVNGLGTVVEIYWMFGGDEKQKAEKSVPLLFDKKTKTIVNNESAEILRMFETSFRPLHSKSAPDLYPAALAEAIGEMNAFTYAAINNGAYKAGFSSKQEVYETAFAAYFEAFDKLETILGKSTWLCGEAVTEADLRLFPTIYRHDPVYHNRMKLNQAFVADYPNLWRWMCDFYALPGVAAQSPLAHMKQGYFGRTGNGTVPIGPKGYPELLADRDYAARRAKFMVN